MTQVFVYGTLKSGFPNHHLNQGVLCTVATTREPFPLYLVGERCSPWMLDSPGQGCRVSGEVYQVDPAGLERMDTLERVGKADGYRRRAVAVIDPAGEILTVQIYLKPPAQLAGAACRDGPHREYTPALAARYVPRDAAS